MRVQPVDGFFEEDLIVFESLQRGGFLLRGFKLTPPYLENADPMHHNAQKVDVVTLLAVLKSGQRLQVQWTVDNDC